MRVGLEQRAGTRQTSPVNDCWPVTLVPAVSEIPSGAGRAISPGVMELLWMPAHSLAVFLTTASSRGMNTISPLFRVFALKMIYHTWPLLNFLHSAWAIVVAMCLVPCKAVPRLQHAEGHCDFSACSRLFSTYPKGPPRLLPPAVPWLGMSVETWQPPHWRAEENKAVTQSCRKISAPLT